MASKYREDEINQLVDQLANRTFEYNQDEDPLYQAYKTQYENQGNRAMKDTLAQVSARTGGLASSYAVGAAQDSYNNYMNQLNDKATDLYQLALSRYNNETSNMQNLLSTYQTLGNTEYNRDQDAYNNAYQASRDAISDARYVDETTYNRNQDALNWAYKNQQQQQSDNDDYLDNLYKIAQATGNATDLEKYYQALGVNDIESAMQNSGYATTYSPGSSTITESEFNRSTAMQKQYGTYQNYLKQTGTKSYSAIPQEGYDFNLTDNDLKTAKAYIPEPEEGETLQESDYMAALEYLRMRATSRSEIESAARIIGIPAEIVTNYIENNKD